ncbi:EamA family transporter [Micromonospora zhanjiangensis]|uniref:DMT family transporter n=1 Tax=Micromonospora zhanjiangensis TaxID=1522057 RepID=A0ABV8KEE7_9ACTN
MRHRSSAGIGLILALLSALSFGTSGTFAHSLLEAGWSAEAAVIARVGIAALVLVAPAVWSLRGRWQTVRGNLRLIGLFGALGVATAQACFFNAVRYLPVGVALLLEYLGVVLVVGWLWLVRGQRPGRLTLVGSAVALVGLVLILDLTGAGRPDPVGVLWGLGAAFGLAGYFVIASRADTGVPAVAMASGGMAVGALLLTVLGLLRVLPLHATFGEVTFAGQRTSWLVPILGLSLVAAAFAYVTGVVSVRMLGAHLSSFVGLTEVIFAVLIAWLVLNELPTAIQLLGGALIVAGVALVRLAELRTDRTAAPSVPDAPPAQPALVGDGRPASTSAYKAP